MLSRKLTRLFERGRITAVFSVVLVGWSLPSAQAQPSASLAQITELELDALEQGARTQQQINELDDRRVVAANEYRTVLNQNTNLKKYNDQLSVTLQSQIEEMDSLKEQISRISHLERDIVPLMVDMLDALEKFIALDVPFLIKERRLRIHTLRGLFADGKVSNAEKYRRILEAYQIENDYGRTIETYDSFVDPENSDEKQHVTFLKIGRVAYLYQTHDGKQSFHWSREKEAWLPLNSRYNEQISEGIKMANEQIPSNLMFVPVAAPTRNTRS